MRRLFINLDKCVECKECAVACSYFYHPQSEGVSSLLEYATFATICRHCEEAPCVNSCYHQALERQSDGHLKRYLMRCTSCKSCTIACPFGVIIPEFIPYLSAKCDYCIAISNKELPKCVAACSHSSVDFKEVNEEPQNFIFFVGDKLAVKSRKWFREEQVLKKK